MLLRVLPTQPHYFQDFKSSFWGKTCNEIKGLQGCPFRREYVQKEGLECYQPLRSAQRSEVLPEVLLRQPLGGDGYAMTKGEHSG